MGIDYCEIGAIELMDLPKYRKISLRYGDGSTVFLWNRCVDEGSSELVKEPALEILSSEVLPRDQIFQIKERLQSNGVRGGAWHDIDE